MIHDGVVDEAHLRATRYHTMPLGCPLSYRHYHTFCHYNDDVTLSGVRFLTGITINHHGATLKD
jgi:hypothetical protein